MATIQSYYTGYLVGTGPRSELVQTDWEFPALAVRLGWNLCRVQRRPRSLERPEGYAVHLKKAPNPGQRCDHQGTDGTVDCRECGATASDFIKGAREYLDSLC